MGFLLRAFSARYRELEARAERNGRLAVQAQDESRRKGRELELANAHIARLYARLEEAGLEMIVEV